ncbi:MAG: hypothetical protein OEV44_02095 [Spirochaetota bacterium]|nr:hypothetical protein [Spirochaetota bacterium]
MVKSLEEFAGWLRFIQAVNWVLIIFGVFGIGFLVFLVIRDIAGLPVAIFIIIDLIVTIYLTFKIIKLLKERSSESPNKIIMLFLWILAATVICVVLEWLMSLIFQIPSYLNVSSKMAIKLVGRPLIPFLFCSAYFKQSKRVKAYYGSNASLSFL